MDAQPRPGARHRRRRFIAGWLGVLAQAAGDARDEGALDPAEDPAQLAFELDGFLVMANMQFVLTGQREATRRARRAIERRLGPA